VRPVIKDCVPVDDFTFPLIRSDNAPDGFCLLRGIDGMGDIEGPSPEYHLFAAGTGVSWSEGEFSPAADRICSPERALQVRRWARDRQTDEMVYPTSSRRSSSPIRSWGSATGSIADSSSLPWINSVH
jgi:aldehyde:ferredoxin oxidoreductase